MRATGAQGGVCTATRFEPLARYNSLGAHGIELDHAVSEPVSVVDFRPFFRRNCPFTSYANANPLSSRGFL